MERIRDVDASGLKELLSGVEVKLAADVTAPFTGHMGAARVFAPQKGADAEATERLEKLWSTFRELLLKLGFIDVFHFRAVARQEVLQAGWHLSPEQR